MQKYGYARVSSRTQKEARQLDALEGYAIPAKNLYVEKCSGKDFDRPQYRKLMRKRAGCTSADGQWKGCHIIRFACRNGKMADCLLVRQVSS